MSGFFKRMTDQVTKVASEVATCAEQTGKYVQSIVDEASKGLQTKKQPSWNTRFYLLMVDLRTLAYTSSRDLKTLRVLTDAAGIPVGMVTPSGFTTKEERGGAAVRCIWIWPSKYENPWQCPVQMLYAHGGAFCLGSPETHKQLGGALAQAGECAVLLPHFRRCPEASVKQASDDVLDVYQWMLALTAAHIDAANFDTKSSSGVQAAIDKASSRIVLAGESAGANLALGLALRIKQGEMVRINGAKVQFPQPCGLVLMSPWTDLVDAVEQTNASWRENEGIDCVLPDLALLFSKFVLCAHKYDGLRDPSTQESRDRLAAMTKEEMLELAKNPLVSPALSTELEGLPPTLVAIGGGETLRDSQLKLVEDLKKANVKVDSEVYPFMPHAFALGNFASSKNFTLPKDIVVRCGAFTRVCCVNATLPKTSNTAAMTTRTLPHATATRGAQGSCFDAFVPARKRAPLWLQQMVEHVVARIATCTVFR
jgi:acetyl esterase/lipase